MAMRFDPEIMRQLVLMFRTELLEQSQMITDGLLTLEKGIFGEQREQCLDQIFRAAHNIKGAARGIDAKDIASIAHNLETLFSKFRREEAAINQKSIDLCLLGLDRMRQIMTALEAGESPDQDGVNDWLNQFDAQQEAMGASMSGIDSKTPAPEPPGGAEAAEKKSVEPVPTIVQPSKPEIAATVGASSREPVRDVESRALPESDQSIRVSLQKLNEFSALVEDLLAAKIEMEEHLGAVKRLFEDAQSFSREWFRYLEVLRKMESVALHDQKGDLLTDKTAGINQFRVSTQQLYKRMRDSNNRCGLTFHQLQEQVRTLHLVPAAVQLQPLARLVRDVALSLNKKVDFDIVGDDIEMDRPILDGIKDPLMHLLRNAIDHGIESPEARRECGKPENGRLTVAVSKERDRILITVSDDGAGVDVDNVARHAVKKKLINQSEVSSLSKAEIIELIFRPGFSSKEIITDISGRGVGLDVVLTGVRNLKGNIKVDTSAGKGTAFVLSLPLTLSSDHGLMVRVSGNIYAIPIASIERVMEIRKQDDLVNIGGNQAILIGGKAIPVRDLAAVLEIGRFQLAAVEKLSLVVISRGWQRVALLVEEIVGEREIVIKRLKSPLKSVRNVMGAAFMGSSEVIVVLNPNDVVVSALRPSDMARLSLQNQTEAVENSAVPEILVVDDSITIRTFEKTLLETCGYRVAVAIDGQSAWELIQKQRFDLVVTDIEMPFMNGFELTERIKRHEKFKKMPVVIVTSLNSEAEKQRGVEVGASAYIVKNQFESRVLLDVVQQLI
jgi:two-component system chemotaxis sensor kinase CheA